MPSQDDKFARLSKRTTDGQAVQPTADVVLRPGQDGDAVASILEHAQDRQVIRISAGTYRLTRAVKITRSLTLVGDGKATTRLVSSAPGDCFTIDGPITFAASGIGFEHEGDTAGNVVVARATKVEFRNCSFRGARNVRDGDDCGAGLTVGGHADVSCDECEATGNRGYGLAFDDDTKGLVANCTATDNGAVGIAVGTRSAVALHCNRASRNQNGIAVGGSSACRVSSNECSDNANSGFNVLEKASPTLETNVATRNKSGVVIGAQASPTALRNTCSENRSGGIDVAHEAHPVLSENRCEKNGNRGILVAGNAYGSVERNICSDNKVCGIFVTDEAHPVVERNTCAHNGEAGIAYKGRATGICRSNNLEGNPENLLVLENASPELQGEGGAPTTVSAASGANAGSGDCFVVTATYGTPFAPEVRRFRAYRDRVLTGYATGRLFVRTYYVIGPALAALIRRLPMLRRLSAKLLGRVARHLPD